MKNQGISKWEKAFWIAVSGLVVLTLAGSVWLISRLLPGSAKKETAPMRVEAETNMVEVPGGDFVMGTSEAHSDAPKKWPGADPLRPNDVLLARAQAGWAHADERPSKDRSLKPFLIDRNEVTNSEYRKFLDAIKRSGDHGRCHPDEPKGQDHTPRYWRDYNPLLKDPSYAANAPFGPDTFRGDKNPVVGVDWYDAYAFAAWAGKRLPTEAEWEKACRGDKGWRWPWGNEWRWGNANTGGEEKGLDIADSGIERDGYIYSAPVGSYQSGRSPFGCNDLAGNVSEWVADWYQADYYAVSPTADPKGPKSGDRRVVPCHAELVGLVVVPVDEVGDRHVGE